MKSAVQGRPTGVQIKGRGAGMATMNLHREDKTGFLMEAGVESVSRMSGNEREDISAEKTGQRKQMHQKSQG